MYLTLETDYAVRIVDCLAHSGKRMSAQEISDGTFVSIRFSLKILRKLVKSSILRSFKGAHGGYELNRPLKEISLHDILKTIEGEYVISRCLAEDHICVRRNAIGECPYNAVFGNISALIQDLLEEATMDKFAVVKEEEENKSPSVYELTPKS